MRRPALAALLVVASVLPALVGAAPAARPGHVEPLDPSALPAQLRVVRTDDAQPWTTVGCEAPFRFDPDTGCVRTVGDGLLEVVGPDGTVATTHGADPADDGHDHVHPGAPAVTEAPSDGPVAAAASWRSADLPTTRRPLVCAASDEARIVVLYGHLRGSADRRSHHLATIRETLERSNHAVAAAAARSGGPLADLPVACDADGRIAVRSVVLPSRAFADVKAALRAAGHQRPMVKYLVFGDFPANTPGVAGIADLFPDDRRSADNHNNGRLPMYALVYGERHFTGPTALHELAHTMGAVQRGAPHADGTGHCTVVADVVCHPGGRPVCGTLAFDCGNDTYFSTSTRPGEWLHEHWNLGWEGNRFIRLDTSGDRAIVSDGIAFRDVHGTTHAEAIRRVAAAGITTGFPDGTFRPGAAVTRAQMATFLVRALDLRSGSAPGFRDVVGSVHEDAVRAVAAAGITTGYRDGTFRPGADVTRGQMASFLSRALELEPSPSRPFTDARGSTHEAAIAAVAAAGITQGFDDGTFRPGDRVTRGQMASFLVRALDV